MKLAKPFVRLPFDFDVSQLQQEVEQLEDSCWMAHPNRMQGNSAVALVSVDGGDNDEFSGRMQVTKHLQRCPYTQQVMASFNEVIARSRLMRLAPHCEVSEHVDFNYHWYDRVRIHIPVITNPQVIFYCGDEKLHMQPGECWIFDSWRRHKVVNASDQTRVHLVIDTAGSGEFWRRVHSMETQSNADVVTTFVPYEAALSPDIRTEKYNVAPVMSPGEMEAMICQLIEDFSANPDNDAKIKEHYIDILMSLAKDWRATWLEFGWEQAALPKYQLLLNRTVKQLLPNPRALVAASNNVGVNPIIMQRILRAALFTDERPRFLS